MDELKAFKINDVCWRFLNFYIRHIEKVDTKNGMSEIYKIQSEYVYAKYIFDKKTGYESSHISAHYICTPTDRELYSLFLLQYGDEFDAM